MYSVSLTHKNAGINTEAGYNSNHEWVWSYFNQEELFINDYRNYKKIVFRLKAEDPRMATNYSSISMNQRRKDVIPPKLEALFKIPLGHLNHNDISLFNTLHIQTTKIRQDKSYKLRHIFNSELPWSPE